MSNTDNLILEKCLLCFPMSEIHIQHFIIDRCFVISFELTLLGMQLRDKI